MKFMKVITNLFQKIHSSQIIHGNSVINKTVEETLNDMKPVTLFAGSSTTAVTLSETIANFSRCIIYFTALGSEHSITVNSNGTWNMPVSQAGGFGSPNYYALRITHCHFYINGTAITPSAIGQNYTIDLKTNGTFQFFDTVAPITIKKVVGYR